MRRSSRRQKKELYCLSKFLETFYGDDLHEVAQNSIVIKSKNVNQIAYKIALSDAVTDPNLKKQLKESCEIDIKKLAVNNPEILSQFGNYVNEDKSNIFRNRYLEQEEKWINKVKKDDNNNYHLWAAALINNRVCRTRLSQSTHFEMAERCKELLLQQS